MAGKTGGSGAFGWFLVGVIVGALGMAAASVYLTRYRDAPTEPDVAAAPPEGSPIAGTPPTGGPVVALPRDPPAPVLRPAPSEDPQIQDDAAATGMTGPVNPPADPPTN